MYQAERSLIRHPSHLLGGVVASFAAFQKYRLYLPYYYQTVCVDNFAHWGLLSLRHSVGEGGLSAFC